MVAEPQPLTPLRLPLPVVEAAPPTVPPRVVESSGYRALDQAAILAVRQSHFGTARSARDEILLTFRFRFED